MTSQSKSVPILFISFGVLSTLTLSTAKSTQPKKVDFLQPYQTSIPATNVLSENTINIDFKGNLSCAACIRGGYFYCDPVLGKAAEGKCCELTDLSCYFDVVNYQCMTNLWVDRFNSLFNFCG